MKCVDLPNVLNRFAANANLSCMLIDGKWGVGKTYAINKWIGTQDKYYKFIKSSFFGKTSLDEINTELYLNLKGKAKQFFGALLNKTIKLVDMAASFAGGNTDISSLLPQKPKRKLKKKKHRQIIVILDDLERKSDSIDMHDVIGYINNLVGQEFKVIVIANTEKIGENKDKNDYAEYKEKVIDREYKIDDADVDVIDNLLQENKVYCDDVCRIVLEDNLRYVIKVNTLFCEIKNYLEEKRIDPGKYDLHELFLFCICVVQECLSGKFTSYYKDYINKLPKDKQGWESALEDCYGRCVKPLWVFFEQKLKMRAGNTNIVPALFKVFEEADFSMLDNYYFPPSNPLNRDEMIYESDEQKAATIKTQYDYIMSLKTADKQMTDMIGHSITKWFEYAYFVLSNVQIDEPKLMQKLHEFGVDNYNFSRVRRSQEMTDFMNRYDEYRKAQSAEGFKTELSLGIDVGIKKFAENINDLNRTFFNVTAEKKDIISKALVTNDFYFNEMIHGKMDDARWGLAHSICNLVNSHFPELKPKLAAMLGKYQRRHKNDKSLKDRICSLQHQYNIK